MPEAHIDTSDIRWLNDAIASFNETALRLETAYRDLEREKSRIDLELERKNGELERTVGDLDALLSSMPAGVLFTDAGGSVRRMNRAAERILGVDAGSWIGRTEGDLADLDGRPLFARFDRGAGEVEAVVRCMDGESRTLRAAVSKVDDGKGRVLGTMWVFSDVTELRDLEEKLAQRSRMAEMGEMAAVLAHQIRNPLNGIAGFGRLILERCDAERQDGVDRFASRIVAGSEKLERLVSELLRFTREDALEESLVDLGRLLADAVEIAGEGPSAGATTTLALPRAGSPATLGDGARLREAMVNLIANAKHAAGEDGSVRVRLRADGERAVIFVHDSGAGMDSETRAKVFHPFFTTKEAGYGLGLPIARKLLERHGGTLTLRSAKGRGCRVRVELPLADEEMNHGAR